MVSGLAGSTLQVGACIIQMIRRSSFARGTGPITRWLDASPYRSRHAKVGRILWMSREKGVIAARTYPRFLCGVAERRPPPRKTSRSDPKMLSLQMKVTGHHPKRCPAAHSKGGEHVPLDCGAARRFGLPPRSPSRSSHAAETGLTRIRVS